MGDAVLRGSGRGYMDPGRLMSWGFSAMMFFIPVATSPAEIAGLAALAVWVLSGRAIRDGKRLLRESWFPPVAAMVLLTWVGLLYTPDVKTGMKFAKNTHYWLYAAAIGSVAFTPRRLSAYLKAYIAGVSFTSGLFLLQLLGLVPMIPPYSVGLLNKWAHISFSLMVTFSMVLLSFYFRQAEGGRPGVGRNRRLALYLMLLNFSALFVLTSDSGHLAFILLSPIMAYNLVSNPNAPAPGRLKVAGVSFLMVVALFLSPVTLGRLMETVDSTASYGEDKEITPVGMRFYMWTGALKIYKDNPVFGVGTGGYRAEMKRYRELGLLPDKRVPGDPVQPHNSFLYMAVSFGIPGLAAIVWLFWVVLKKSWPMRGSLLGFSIISFTLVLLIGSLTDSQIMQVHTAKLFAVFTGLLGASDASGSG